MDFSKLFSKGFDPTSLLLGGLSLFGGQDGPQQIQSYRNPGQHTDPQQSLGEVMQAIMRLGQGLTERAPFQTRSSYAPAPQIKPVTIPGIPFQIGGGFPRDPANDDPSLLVAQQRGGTQYDPFQSLIPQKQNQTPSAAVNRRKPNG